jgi:light-harvesting complex II chlorophyll a/b binding protein 4
MPAPIVFAAKAPVKPVIKTSTPAKKPFAVRKPTPAARKSVSRRSDDELALPGTERPAWLDGSLPGDRGFDPWGLAKPVEYLQMDLDRLDQNAPKNPSGRVIGKLKKVDNKPQARTIVPYNESFDIMRFRECELLHSRWAMLGLLGAAAAEAATGVSWADAGKVELEQPQYLGFPFPGITVTALTIIEVLAMGYVEVQRSAELDQNKRMYPGGAFDPLGYIASADSEEQFRLKTAELKHGRLAMVGMALISIEAASGKSALFFTQ